MGQVFKARHVQMDRIVGLKIIPKECLANANAVSRFYREVRAVAKLSHPNVVAAHDAGQEGDTHYLAMEFIEGIDLAKLVRQSGPLPIAQACDFIRQAALGLQHANEKGLVHRDIKPGNIIVGVGSDRGPPVAKILDFGLARFEDQSGQTKLTKLGNVLGTVDYISPEQAGDAREVDTRADIFSLGCALFYVLTGKPPFEGATAMDRMMARCVRDADSVRTARPEVPAALERVLAKMLARNRADRYQSPAEVAAALTPFTSMGATASPKREKEAGPQSSSAGREAAVPSFEFETMTNAAGVIAGPRKKVAAGPWSKRTLITAGVAVALLIGTIAMWPGGVFRTRPAPDPAADPGRDNKKKQLPPPNEIAKGNGKDAAPPFRVKEILNSIGMKLVYIPPGKFMMGSPKDEKDRRDNEDQHEVRITRGFYMGACEVTQEEYEKVLGQKPSWFSPDGDGKNSVKGFDNTRRFPVEQVSWNDAMDFCKELSRKEGKEGKEYDLPTEAEWEYGCRAGTDTVFHYANALSSDLANLDGSFPYGGAPPGPFLGMTKEVGSYRPNALGLHDMHGNVCEWCKDRYGHDYYQDSPVRDPQGPSEGKFQFRVHRGGSFINYAKDCRSAYRYPELPGNHGKNKNLGFRVVLRVFESVAQQPKLPAVPEPAKPNSPPADKEITNSIGMKLMYIPAGKFLMGSPNSEVERRDNEFQHSVEITKGFYMGAYEVTQEEYQKVMDSTPSWFSPSGGGKDAVSGLDTQRFPVEKVSWNDAKEFCKKLAQQESKAYDLPTEAEWEYACRARTDTLFHYGNALSSDLANFNGDFPYGGAAKGRYLQRTNKVGSYLPNAFGLYDMHGNVWEWCKDWYDDKGVYRVLRGGSFNFNARNCRSACRGYDHLPDSRRGITGFRVVLRVPDSVAQQQQPKLLTAVPEQAKPNSPPADKEITNSIGMKLVYVPPGKFMMGSPKDEKDRRDGEDQHEVRITRGFYMGAYEVTQEEYKKVLGNNPSWFSPDGGGKNAVDGFDNTRRFPVEQVSWNDAMAFCKKLSAKEGKDYDLPTEAEWEYGCRAGTDTVFHCGNTLSSGQANCNGALDRTGNVGSYRPNAFGLYDMHGNVWEWCKDRYGPDYYQKSPADDPQGPTEGKLRVLRGGSYYDVARGCRSAYRYGLLPGNRDYYYGFRVVLRAP